MLRSSDTSVPAWFKWSPGLVLSYTKLNWFRDLVNDKFYGRLGTNSTKIVGYREVYPDLLERKKQTGFENTDELILEFENFIINKHGELPYRSSCDRSLDSLWLEISGNHYV